MPNIKLTENLRNTIRDLRKEKKKRGDELSKEIGKGSAYISQIENGKIKEIDFDLLDNIFRKITDLDDKQYEIFLNNLLDETTLHLTKEELQHEKWVHQFNHEIRKFPVTDSLIEFIQNKLTELHYTPEEFIDIINENRGLNGKELPEANKLNIEIEDSEDGGYYIISSIRFDLPHNLISKILSKELKSINYVTMEGIIFNLLLSENHSVEDAKNQSDKILFDNHFYTIRQRNKLIRENLKEKRNNNEKITFYDVQPTDYDKKYTELKKDIVDALNYLRDRDIVYVCERLEILQKNMHDDLGLIIAIMSSPLFKIDKEIKKEFWEDYVDLVNTYIDKKNTDRE